MEVEMNRLAETRTGEILEAELRKDANFVQKQKEWRSAIKKFDGIVSESHEQFLSLQEVEDVFLEYNSAYGEAAYKRGYSDGVMIGMEQRPDRTKSTLTLGDMENLICVYDAIRQMEKTLLGKPYGHWENMNTSSVFERVFNIICSAASAKIKFWGEDKAIDFIIGVLSDDTMEMGEKAMKLLGIE